MHKKQNIFLVAEYFQRYSDMSHGITLKDIEKYINTKGFNAERRAIYNYINELNDLGIIKTSYEIKGINKYCYYREESVTVERACRILKEIAPNCSKSTFRTVRKLLEEKMSDYQKEELDKRINNRNHVEEFIE